VSFVLIHFCTFHFKTTFVGRCYCLLRYFATSLYLINSFKSYNLKQLKIKSSNIEHVSSPMIPLYTFKIFQLQFKFFCCTKETVHRRYVAGSRLCQDNCKEIMLDNSNITSHILLTGFMIKNMNGRRCC